MNASRVLLAAGCLGGGLAVVLGAFGAHALKARLTEAALLTFETGVRYQMYHAFAILAAVWMADRLHSGLPLTAGWLFLGGVTLFSGSLYLLATRTLLGLESWTWLGPVTPLGGLCFISGWIVLTVAALRGG